MPGAPRAASVWRSDQHRSDVPRQARRSLVQRLKTRSQFQAVLAGERIASTAHFVLHRQVLPYQLRAQVAASPLRADMFAPVPADGVWLGAMVPKRWARRAVTRNAIKRQIYAVSSQFDFDACAAAHVVRLRAAFDRKQFVSASSTLLKAQVRQELTQLFDSMRRTLRTRATDSPDATA